jgi:hypothetical protein
MRLSKRGLADAVELGATHGRNAGSWVIDGNTSSEEARRLLAGIEDGDPEVTELQPSALSGEWADGLTPRTLLEELGINWTEREDPDHVAGDLCDVYELAYGEAFWAEVERSARAILGQEQSS